MTSSDVLSSVAEALHYFGAHRPDSPRHAAWVALDKFLEGDPEEVQPSDSRAESQAALNGPSSRPTSPPKPARLGRTDAAPRSQLPLRDQEKWIIEPNREQDVARTRQHFSSLIAGLKTAEEVTGRIRYELEYEREVSDALRRRVAELEARLAEIVGAGEGSRPSLPVAPDGPDSDRTAE